MLRQSESSLNCRHESLGAGGFSTPAIVTARTDLPSPALASTVQEAVRGCPDTMVCHCLQVTEATLVDALENQRIRTLRDVIVCTGAGDGCTACHRRIRRYLEEHAD